MEKIIIEKKYGSKYDDVMYAIANDKKMITYMGWGYERLILGYDDVDAENCNLAEYLEYIAKKMETMDKSSVEYQNLNEFMKQRNLNEYGFELREEFDLVFSNGVFYKVIEILTDEDTRNKFIDYQNNKEAFYVTYEQNGKIYPASMSIDIFIRIMTSMFGAPNENGELDNQRLYSQFYIPDIEKYKKAYLEMYERLEFERYIPKDYRFKNYYISESVACIIKDDSEPQWKLNDAVRDAVYSGIPEDLSIEEEAIYVYYKLCQLFTYDEGYVYRDKLKKQNYTSKFSKDYLEGIVPGDKITCYDFSRIYAKIISEMEQEIDGVIISTGLNNGHFFTGFSTKEGAVELEAINATRSEDGEILNDLLRAKLGQKLEGIRTVFGHDEVFKNANEKIYNIFNKQHEKNQAEGLIEEIKQEQDEEIPQNFELCAQILIENMKKIGISGNEFSMVFSNILRKGLFGDNIDCAYIGTIEKKENKEKGYKRIICVCEKQDEKFKFYLIDTGSLELTKSSEDEIKRKLDSNEFVYENSDRTIETINR
ncbi:MAG: hypothetical protein IJH12_04110 [Clostridia bacterium]|nr:hypothetical protein [Clostridia bacterium]